MKGYAITEWGKPLSMVPFPDPKPVGKEVLVKVLASGLCHSDLHMKDGYFGGHGGEGLKLNFTDMGCKLPCFQGTRSMALFRTSDPTLG